MIVGVHHLRMEVVAAANVLAHRFTRIIGLGIRPEHVMVPQGACTGNLQPEWITPRKLRRLPDDVKPRL
jgi:hypothetical protein